MLQTDDTRQADRRQTADGRATAYSEREREVTPAAASLRLNRLYEKIVSSDHC